MTPLRCLFVCLLNNIDYTDTNQIFMNYQQFSASERACFREKLMYLLVSHVCCTSRDTKLREITYSITSLKTPRGMYITPAMRTTTIKRYIPIIIRTPLAIDDRVSKCSPIFLSGSGYS